MICPKCEKEFLSGDVCPYCGAEVAKEKVALGEAVSNSAEETETEAITDAAEVEEAAEAEETAEAEEADYVDDTEEKIAEALRAEKKAKNAVNVLAALIVVAVIIIAAMAAMMFIDKKGDDIAETTASDVTTDAAATDAAEVTDSAEIVQGTIPFEDKFPEGHTVNYPNGYPYKDASIDEYIKLGDYKGKSAEVSLPETMSEEEFANQINYFLMQYAELGDAVTDRPAAVNDTVLIDYAGTLDGVAFEGGTATDATATLGMGQYIPGFEEGIVGMSIGETKDIAVTFPENYGVDTLNGKAVIFKITLKSITENKLPEYNDDFVMTNFGIATVAEFEEELRTMNAEEAMSERRSAIMQIVMEGAEIIAYPEGTVEDYIYQQSSSDMLTSSQYGMSVEDYISYYYGMGVSEYEEQVTEMAEEMVAQELAIYAVAKAEGLEVTDEDIAVEAADILEYYGETDIASLCTSMGISEELLENSLHFSAVYNKVTDFMIKNTTFTVVE